MMDLDVVFFLVGSQERNDKDWMVHTLSYQRGRDIETAKVNHKPPTTVHHIVMILSVLLSISCFVSLSPCLLLSVLGMSMSMFHTSPCVAGAHPVVMILFFLCLCLSTSRSSSLCAHVPLSVSSYCLPALLSLSAPLSMFIWFFRFVFVCFFVCFVAV